MRNVLPEGYQFQPLSLDDAGALTVTQRRNREHLGPWEPARPTEFYTLEGQRAAIEGRLGFVGSGLFECWLLWHDDDVVGSANLQNIVRGAMQGGTLGYWVDVGHLRRGLASAAVEHLVERGRALGLHRLEAGTMVENLASQRLLLKAGFVPYGTVPKFLHIAGGWRDHHLYQRILHDGPPHSGGGE